MIWLGPTYESFVTIIKDVWGVVKSFNIAKGKCVINPLLPLQMRKFEDKG